MPSAYDELREQLSRRPLPTSLPIAKVMRVMQDMGYSLKVTGSHHIFRKPGAQPLNFSVHKKRLRPESVKELATLFEEWG